MKIFRVQWVRVFISAYWLSSSGGFFHPSTFTLLLQPFYHHLKCPSDLHRMSPDLAMDK